MESSAQILIQYISEYLTQDHQNGLIVLVLQYYLLLSSLRHKCQEISTSCFIPALRRKSRLQRTCSLGIAVHQAALTFNSLTGL